jgi:hypothetical protein
MKRKVWLFARGNLGIILFICGLFNKARSSSRHILVLNSIMPNELWIHYFEATDHVSFQDRVSEIEKIGMLPLYSISYDFKIIGSYYCKS